MEQEPVYVPSNRLATLAESLLGKIFARRQENQESYVRDRVNQYNTNILRKNHWRKMFHIRPKMFITPQGMELEIKRELDAMPEDQKQNHPMIQIHMEYGRLEHEAKDALIMCQYNETVLVSPDFARGVSHLGIDLRPLAKQPFGFTPSR